MTPLPKVFVPKGKTDYRGINITPVIVRAFEKSVFHIHARDRGSRIDVLLSMQHTVYCYFEDPKCKVLRLFAMDFSKALDSVNHELLSYKFQDVLLNPFIINWYLSFLENRQQCIIYNSFQGQWKCVNRGTTQGSVSGPYLFNIFINDLEISVDNNPALFKYADDFTRIVPVWSNGHCRTDLEDQLLTWSKENSIISNPSKCKEIIFRKKGCIHDIVEVNNIPQCTELPILGVTFQENCKYSEHVRAKLIKANKCLFVLRSLRKEGFSQGEVDHLFSALVLPNFTYGLPVYGAVDSDLTVIQNVLDRCFKRKYTSKRMDIRELLEKADKKLFKVRSVDPDCPLSNIIPKKKETKYLLRNKSAHRPDIKTDRFKNVFVNRIIFRYNL